MLKTLLRKQIREVLGSFGKNGKKGKKRSGAGKVGLVILILYCFLAVAMLFFMISSTLCGPLLGVGLGWLYFTLIGLMATGVGVVGSVFSTYSALYAAKDNELLLSLPIKPKYILFSRLTGVYLLTLLFEAVVLIPSFVSRLAEGSVSAVTIVAGVLSLFVLPLLAVVIACFLGWLIALIVPLVKHKSLVGTALYLIFFGLYFWGYSNLQSGLQLLLVNAESVGRKMSLFAYPFVKLGEGLDGDILSFAVFVLITAALFLIVYRVLSASFLKLATTRRGEVRREYHEEKEKIGQKSPEKALLRREWQHFTRSTAYLLNCGLGMILMPVGCAAAILKADSLRGLLDMMPGLTDYVPLIVTGAVCILCSMNSVTAPSISLEANTLTTLKALPVESFAILKAKLRLHNLVSAPAAVLLTVVLGVVMKTDYSGILVSAVTVVLFVFCYGVCGLQLNLRHPNLNWSSETAAVKQSMSALVTIFGSWGVMVLLAAGAYFLKDTLAPGSYAAAVLVLFALLYRVLWSRLSREGVRLFEEL